ncbi:MAG TPA: SDR family NAD(P)-dependent oxidoreductase [Terriglobia bacterium]|nr:SDR family NAD(P)-dependent oxidoreductase [Terriglobia bacterium]
MSVLHGEAAKMDFENRVALVTGGTGALGSAVALDFLASGARVTVTYASENEWQALRERAAQRHPRLEGLRVDLTNPGEVETALRKLLASQDGRMDYIVCVAGGFAAGNSFETGDQTWDHMLNLNLRTVINVVRPLAPVLIAQKSGHIVTISSGAILNAPGAGIAAYAISKGAVRHLSEILAEELRPHGVRVHCLMPGTMDTPANRRAMPAADFSKWVKTDKVAALIHELVVRSDKDSGPVVVPVLE